MSLNKAKLQQDILDMMKRGVAEKWNEGQAAQALANAIDSFVRTGTVSGVEVTVVDRTWRQHGEVAVR